MQNQRGDRDVQVGEKFRDRLTGDVVTVKSITRFGRTYYTGSDGVDHAAYHSAFWPGGVEHRFDRIEGADDGS